MESKRKKKEMMTVIYKNDKQTNKQTNKQQQQTNKQTNSFVQINVSWEIRRKKFIKSPTKKSVWNKKEIKYQLTKKMIPT